MTAQNRQFKLSARPVGMVKRSDFEFTSAAIPEPGPGQVLIRVMYVSLDPAMRGWMNEGRSYIPPVALGEVMRAGTAGRVVASNNPKFAVGDYVAGWGGVQAEPLRQSLADRGAIVPGRQGLLGAGLEAAEAVQHHVHLLPVDRLAEGEAAPTRRLGEIHARSSLPRTVADRRGVLGEQLREAGARISRGDADRLPSVRGGQVHDVAGAAARATAARASSGAATRAAARASDRHAAAGQALLRGPAGAAGEPA